MRPFLRPAPLLASAAAVALAAVLTAEASGPVLAPITDADFHQNAAFPEAQVTLGRMLFLDKILSGNRNISCATCHHPNHASADGLALGIGEGGVGLGPDRHGPAGEAVLGRVPRNAPALRFAGRRALTALFHDGRVEAAPNGPWPSGFWTPAREQLPEGLDGALGSLNHRMRLSAARDHARAAPLAACVIAVDPTSR